MRAPALVAWAALLAAAAGGAEAVAAVPRAAAGADGTAVVSRASLRAGAAITGKATHFWDCNGAACDSRTLQPFVPRNYRYSAQYAPLDPGDYGGSAYGERLWMTGAASDSLSTLLGADDGCCGTDPDGGGGCGKCVLVRNPGAVNADWSAVVMKKNRCPPWSSGCEAGNVNLDVAVPGFDNLQFSTANICGARPRARSSAPPSPPPAL